AHRRAGRAPARRLVPGRPARLPRLRLPHRLPRRAPRGGGRAVRGRHAKVSEHQLPLFDLAPPAPRLELVPDLPVDEEERCAARELGTDLVLRAGAGTGKTHTLVQAVAHLVAGATRLGRRGPIRSILVLTFREKAAAELRERIRAKLAELAATPRGDRALEEAYRRLGVPAVGADGWRAAVLALGAAPITTFHGFAAGLLRRHATAAGLDPAFAILDEDEAETLLRTPADEVV